MKKPMARLSVLAILALLLALCLLATAGPATAGTPKGAPSFTWYGGLSDFLDNGDWHPDCPAAGNLTVLHWRTSWSIQVRLPRETREQSWWIITDLNMVLLDKPDGTPGWHFHSGTSIWCSENPLDYSWPLLPPTSSWLWTSKDTGVTTPAGVHYFIDDLTGWNQYKGLKAYGTWTMADPYFQDAVGKVWIRH